MSEYPSKLFVGRLCAQTNDDSLRQHFERFGDLIDHVVIRHKTQKRSRCFGFVTYAKPEQADAVMAAIPHTVDGYAVELKQAIAKEQCPKSDSFGSAMEKKIFVGGLKDDIFEFHLTQYFSQYGQVEKSEIMIDLKTRKNRGFGFVHFTDPSAVENAVVEKFHTVNEHQVEVKKALTKQEIRGEDGTEPRVMVGNQNGYDSRGCPGNNSNGAYGGSHGAEFPDPGSSYAGYNGYENASGFNSNGAYGGSPEAELPDQESSYAGYNGYENASGFNSNGAYGGSNTVVGNAVEVDWAVEKAQFHEPNPFSNAMRKKIFVGGLKDNILDFHLTQYFSQYGQVEKSEIMTYKETGKNRGFGFVHFTDPSAVENAVVEKFHTVKGHKVEVKKALTKQEIQGGDRTAPRNYPRNNSNLGYGGLHGAGYSDQGISDFRSYGYGNGAGFYDDEGYGFSYGAGYSDQGSYYGGYHSYGNGSGFNGNGGYSGTYTCGRCGYENVLGGWDVYNSYGQGYSGYRPNNGHFDGQRTAPYTRGC